MRRMFSENQLENKIKNVKKDISTLVDSNGNDRFVEGDITIETVAGISQTFGKWALSGTHLMIVLRLSYVAETALSASQLICKISNLPQWIFNKINPLFSKFVLTPKFQAWSSSGAASDFALYLTKESNELQLIMGSNFSATTDRAVRCDYDLLID